MMSILTEEDVVAQCKRLDPKFALSIVAEAHGVVISASAPGVGLSWARVVEPGDDGAVDEKVEDAARLEVLAVALQGLKAARSIS